MHVVYAYSLCMQTIFQLTYRRRSAPRTLGGVIWKEGAGESECLSSRGCQGRPHPPNKPKSTKIYDKS